MDITTDSYSFANIELHLSTRGKATRISKAENCQFVATAFLANHLLHIFVNRDILHDIHRSAREIFKLLWEQEIEPVFLFEFGIDFGAAQ